MGKGKKKTKLKPKVNTEPTELIQAPHSFVIHRGLFCPYITDLTKDFRRVMEPNTAMNLREKKNNKIKDFVSLSSYFHVSYMCIFNKATTQLSFKLIRMPRGPTLTFKVHEFTLARDVISSSKKQYVGAEIFKTPPLVIMNNFSGEGKHLKLMAHTFQTMFPAININTADINDIKRCVLFNYDPSSKIIQFRHYSIVVVPVGLSKGVKKVVLRKVPNLSKCEDISDYFNGCASESEFEDDEDSQVILPQTLKSKGNLEDNKSAVRLYEVGPRLSLELVKIEEGLLTGEVLYHETIIKTEEEVEQLRKMREKKKKLKEHRRKIQEQNVQRKLKEKLKKSDQTKGDNENQEIDVEPDDDAEYYKQEVGEEPDEEIFKKSDNEATKRMKLPKYLIAKKRKLNEKVEKSKKDKLVTSHSKKSKMSSHKDEFESNKRIKKSKKSLDNNEKKTKKFGLKDGKFKKAIYNKKFAVKSKNPAMKKRKK